MTCTLRRVDFESEFVRLEAFEHRPLLRQLVSVQAPYRPLSIWQAWAHPIAFVLFIGVLVAAICWVGVPLEFARP